MIRWQVDTRRLDAFQREASRVLPRVQEALLRPRLNALLKKVIELSPRDTHRYVRGWQMAANAAGLGPFAVADVRPSSGAYAASLREQFRSQAAYYERLAREWEERASNAELRAGTAGTDRRGRRVRRGSARLRQIADQAAFVARRAREEEAKLNDTSILILGRETKRKFAVRQLITVREHPKGGTATRRVVGGVVIYTLRNAEPHAIIVEGKHGVVKRAETLLQGEAVRILKAGMEAALRRIASGRLAA